MIIKPIGFWQALRDFRSNIWYFIPHFQSGIPENMPYIWLGYWLITWDFPFPRNINVSFMQD